MTQLFSPLPLSFGSGLSILFGESEERGEQAMTLPFGETLRRLRIEKGLSQQQLADRLHVGRTSGLDLCRDRLRYPVRGLL